jgi:hemerythrin
MPYKTLPSTLISGVPAIDSLHEEFLEALIGLSSASDTDFVDRYQDFVKQAEEAFRVEEEWMEQLDLPIIKSHREQHARVLGALHHVYSRIQDGDLTVGKEVVKRLLPRWFILHISTMDAALASAMLGNGRQAAGLSFAR